MGFLCDAEVHGALSCVASAEDETGVGFALLGKKGQRGKEPVYVERTCMDSFRGWGLMKPNTKGEYFHVEEPSWGSLRKAFPSPHVRNTWFLGVILL